MKTTFLLSVMMCLFATTAWSQTDATTTSAKKAAVTQQSTSPGEGAADQYNYHDKKIIKAMKSGQIPADFPKFDSSSMTDEQYAETCRRWMYDHKELIVQEYYVKLERKYGGK